MTWPSIELAGRGLHGGREARVRFVARPGPVAVRQGEVEVALEALRVVGTERATTVAGRDSRGGEVRVATLEHVLAALAGLGIRSGLRIELEGDEPPLLDGGAGAYCAALQAIAGGGGRGDRGEGAPRLCVARAGSVEVGASTYAFEPGAAPSLAVELDVGGDPRLAPRAAWAGDARDFVARIAPARTFAFARDVEGLLAQGLARHVEPASVVVVSADVIHHAGRPFAADEPARHKLLDLAGDLYLHGGPPNGTVVARRPGHAATHAAVARALAEGVLCVVRPAP